MKKILYTDMDGVVVDFDAGIKKFVPYLHTGENYPDAESRGKMVDKVCEMNPYIFHNLEPIAGAIEAIETLWPVYDIYFLSTGMWNVPLSFSGKRVWLERHFGDKAAKRLILTHRKDLCIGDYLIDDRIKNGVEGFLGEHIHFGQGDFPDWDSVVKYLLWKDNDDKLTPQGEEVLLSEEHRAMLLDGLKTLLRRANVKQEVQK